MYVTLSRVIFYARHARSIIDNYARLGCYVRTYAYAHVSNITSRKIIFHMKTDGDAWNCNFDPFEDWRLLTYSFFSDGIFVTIVAQSFSRNDYAVK